MSTRASWVATHGRAAGRGLHPGSGGGPIAGGVAIAVDAPGSRGTLLRMEHITAWVAVLAAAVAVVAVIVVAITAKLRR